MAISTTSIRASVFVFGQSGLFNTKDIGLHYKPISLTSNRFPFLANLKK